ncbi:MAG: tocopherol cyclase family protein [Lachnospiraceae bacterium]
MKGTFYGWYMKCQSASHTLAVIPAVHQSGKERTCSIQLITECDAWNAIFLPEMFRKQGKNLWIGDNQFGQNGFRLKIRMPGLTADGKLDFGAISPLRYDIMGPFAMIPFLECRHHVWSMRHTVNGTLRINDQTFRFRNAKGYWEGDEGRSFPKQYAWTQCFFEGGSLMLSVADIPMAGIHFTGVIAVILWKGKEYRLATYLGAKVVQIQNGKIRIVQGDMELEARLLEKVKCSLKAPMAGNMNRTNCILL